MVPDTLQISTAKYDKNVATASVFDGTFSISVLKGGKGSDEGTLCIAYQDTLVTWYNENYKTEYKAIPENLVQFSETELNFAATDAAKSVSINWDPESVANSIGLGDEGNYVVPIKIISSNLDVTENMEYVLLKVTKPYIQFASTNAIERVASFLNDYKDTQSVTIEINEVLDNETQIFVEVDNSLVSKWNAEHNLNYEPAPSKLIQFPLKTAIAAGETSVKMDFVISSKAYYDNFNDGRELTGIVAPVKLTVSKSEGINLNVASESLFYVVVTPPVIPDAVINTEIIRNAAIPEAKAITLSGDMSLNLPVLGLDTKVYYEIDNSLISAYNAANGTSYVAASDGVVTLPEYATIQENKTEGQFTLVLNNPLLPARGTTSDLLVPLKFKYYKLGDVEIALNGVCYLIIEYKPHAEIMGNDDWELLEGEELSIGYDPVFGTAWYREHYSSKGLCDGNLAIGLTYPEGHVWGAWFDTPMDLPLEFVFDMKVLHKPDKVLKHEFSSFQGSWNHIQIYLSYEYGRNGVDADWKLAYDGTLGAPGWVSNTGEKYEDEMTGDVIGRYLKIVLVEPTGMYYANSDSHMAGYIREIWFEGY